MKIFYLFIIKKMTLINYETPITVYGVVSDYRNDKQTNIIN